MINFDDFTKGNIKKHNPNWPQISDHPYKISVTGGLEFGKRNYIYIYITILYILYINYTIYQLKKIKKDKEQTQKRNKML